MKRVFLPHHCTKNIKFTFSTVCSYPEVSSSSAVGHFAMQLGVTTMLAQIIDYGTASNLKIIGNDVRDSALKSRYAETLR